MRITKFGITLFALLAVTSGSAFAQDGSNVLVVVNSASPIGPKIGELYAAARKVPTDHIVNVTTTLDEEIERERYVRDIEGPLGAWITKRAAQDRILYIVLTKDIPLRIRGSGGMDGSVASVDSELRRRHSVGSPTRISLAIAILRRRSVSHTKSTIFIWSRVSTDSRLRIFCN